jgi:hypothetical protein
MAIDTSVQTFTDQEMLDLIRQSIAHVLTGGQSVGDNSKNVIRASLRELREMEEQYQARVTESTEGGAVLVRYGERV